MLVGDLSFEAFAGQLAETGVTIRTGPFVSRINSDLRELAPPIHLLYQDFPIVRESFIDFHVRVRPAPGLRYKLSPHILFALDNQPAFHPFQRNLALPLFEWGMNWCVYNHAHQFLIAHAAVVQKGAVTCMLPGKSGSGKSTLCAALVSRGWRLLSDELAIWRPNEHRILPIARPISLKNQSIQLIKNFAPDQIFGPYFGKTAKGALAHMKPPAESVRKMDEASAATHIIFPVYVPDSDPALEAISQKEAFVRISDFAVNYPMQGREAFESLVDVIGRCDCFAFRYASLDDAVRIFNDLQ